MSMIALTFPDGSSRDYESGISGSELAASISKSLAKKAVALVIDGELADLADPLERDASVKIISRTDDEALELIRHDCAHVLAEAVQELFPGTQVTIGPVIENGFYYDFAREEPFRPDDLERIEARMREIIKRNAPFTKEVWSREDAIAHFKAVGEDYKVELIDAIPAGEDLRIYRQGDWLDLCRGPHMTSTGQVGTAFKLTTVAGAYWRGDSNNAMLQRIYGTAWASDKDLKAHLHRLEEAERRDHRKLGREMDLFHFQEEGPGVVFWHPKGWELVPAPDELHAPAPERCRLPGGQRTAGPGSGIVGDVRPLGLVSRKHVHHGDGRRAPVRDQADELPGPRADLQAWAEGLTASCPTG